MGALFELLLCGIGFLIWAARDVQKDRKARKMTYYWYHNTNMSREIDLFNQYNFFHKEADGTPIPYDYKPVEVWRLVAKQLQKEGLRLSPISCDLSKFRFDKNGRLIGRVKN